MRGGEGEGTACDREGEREGMERGGKERERENL